MKNNLNNHHQGFSLVELMIVVVVIGILATIAIPNLLSSRRAANEGSAVSDLRTIHGAQMTYASSFGNGDFAGNLGSAVNVEMLTQLGAVSIIDSLLAGGVKSGYLFSGAKVDKSATNPSGFCARAIPISGSGAFATGPNNVAVATEGVFYRGPATNVNAAGCSIVSGAAVITLASPMN